MLYWLSPVVILRWLVLLVVSSCKCMSSFFTGCLQFHVMMISLLVFSNCGIYIFCPSSHIGVFLLPSQRNGVPPVVAGDHQSQHRQDRQEAFSAIKAIATLSCGWPVVGKFIEFPAAGPPTSLPRLVDRSEATARSFAAIARRVEELRGHHHFRFDGGNPPKSSQADR